MDKIRTTWTNLINWCKVADNRKLVLTTGLKWLKWTLIGFFGSTLFFVLLYKFVNPPVTTFMVYQRVAGVFTGNGAPIQKKWVRIEKISPNMVKAVIASEDNLFVTHWGIDTQAISKAIKHNKKSKKVHGASTITQQTAKNVFLWPGRSFIRKGLELYFTLLIEGFWGKERIMEVYLNVIETGKGIYGVEKAAHIYFNTTSTKLPRSQAALIAGALPSPKKYNPGKPGPYLQKRKNKIVSLMDKIETLKID